MTDMVRSVREVIFESHSELIKWLRLGMAADLQCNPKASVFDELEMRCKNGPLS